MKCLSTNTKSGIPCQRKVAARGCPDHGMDHVQDRLRKAVVFVEPTYQQGELFPLTRDQIKQLIEEGRRSVQPEDICGCQG